jgi:hypothetical protein
VTRFFGADVRRGLSSCDRETKHMTQQKKLKRAVRARSEKTGESYTAARRQLLKSQEKKSAQASPTESLPHTPAIPATPAPRAAKSTAPPTVKTSRKKAAASTPAASPRGQVSDDSARKKTGHGLDHWFAVLDAFGAAAKGHTAAAAHLYDAHGVPGWYAQGITVAYERVHGLREMNQACNGGFQVSVTKTVPAPVAEVVAALQSAKRRQAWLAAADPELARALESAFTGPKPKEVKSKGSDFARLRFRWGATTVEIRITGKATGASVAADNMGLSDAGQVEERRTQWRTALASLHQHLGSVG